MDQDKRIPCVVVTGASAGIGRATAKAFGKLGWRVALLARGKDGLEGACKEIREAGGEAMMITVDVADHAQVEAAADQVEHEFGPIDVWVNNAMATIFCPVDQIAPEDFERATKVTYLGSVWGIMAALKRMKPRNRGTIIQIGSALAYRSIPLQAPYCGAKSALRGFIDSLRSELIHDKSDIHLTMVHLSAFNTPQFNWGRTCLHLRAQPLPPIFQPELAARAVVWSAVGDAPAPRTLGRLPGGKGDSGNAHRAWLDRWHSGSLRICAATYRSASTLRSQGQPVRTGSRRSRRAWTLRRPRPFVQLAILVDDTSLDDGGSRGGDDAIAGNRLRLVAMIT